MKAASYLALVCVLALASFAHVASAHKNHSPVDDVTSTGVITPTKLDAPEPVRLAW